MTRHIRDNGGGRGFTYCGTAIPRGRGRTDKFGRWPVVKVAREPGEATCRPCRGGALRRPGVPRANGAHGPGSLSEHQGDGRGLGLRAGDQANDPEGVRA